MSVKKQIVIILIYKS